MTETISLLGSDSARFNNSKMLGCVDIQSLAFGPVDERRTWSVAYCQPYPAF